MTSAPPASSRRRASPRTEGGTHPPEKLPVHPRGHLGCTLPTLLPMPPGAHGSENRHMHTCSRGTVEVPQARRGAGFQPSLYEAGGAAGPAQGSPTFQRLGPGNREGPRPASAERKGARNGLPGRGARRGLGPSLTRRAACVYTGQGERKTCAASLLGPHMPPPTRSAHRRPPGAPRAQAPDTHPGPDFSSLHPGTHPQGRAPGIQRPPQSRSPLPHASAPAPEAPAGLMPGSGPQSHPLLRKPLWAVPTSHAPPESPPHAPLHSAWGTLPRGLSPPARQHPPGRGSFPSLEAPRLTQEALRGARHTAVRLPCGHKPAGTGVCLLGLPLPPGPRSTCCFAET